MPSFVQMPPEQFVALADALDARPVIPQVVLGCPCLRRAEPAPARFAEVFVDMSGVCDDDMA
jgi:hypothetical protein